MIKHRFILRSKDDFKVFAAIPVETSVLTWKKWVRPPDLAAFKEVAIRYTQAMARLADSFDTLAVYCDECAAVPIDMVPVGNPEEEARKIRRNAEYSREVVALLRKRLAEWETHEIEQLTEVTQDQFAAALEGAVASFTQESVEIIKDVHPNGKALRGWRALHPSKACPSYVIAGRVLMYEQKVEIGKFARDESDYFCGMRDRFLSSDPLPDTPCPPGVPFAAYTVEFDGTVVNVIEGCAWIALRPRPPQEVIDKVAKSVGDEMLDKLAAGVIEEEVRRTVTDVSDRAFVPTDDEKRVVEIVSQMLTERSLNPKADTKIPVREIDPAKAHQTREAEKRAHSPGVRTIKFEVTPPRYLREAAERILTSPRRAHWVVGHWRNQAFGEKHGMRRQKWIKPHIRGLGEASATVSRVVAPKPDKPTEPRV